MAIIEIGVAIRLSLTAIGIYSGNGNCSENAAVANWLFNGFKIAIVINVVLNGLANKQDAFLSEKAGIEGYAIMSTREGRRRELAYFILGLISPMKAISEVWLQEQTPKIFTGRYAANKTKTTNFAMKGVVGSS